MFVISTILCGCALFGHISPSAIPMWEYQSKDEQRQFLYSKFTNQVEEFCEQNGAVRDCVRELSVNGLKNLNGMTDDQLDATDPYQRDADKLIWNALMKGHPLSTASVVRPRHRTASPKPNSYDDDLSISDDFFETAASASIDGYRVPPPSNFQVVAPPKGFVYFRPTPTAAHQNSIETIDSDSLPFENIYPRKSYRGSAAARLRHPVRSYQRAPLTGPLATWVRLDGTPLVDHPVYPHDQDLTEYQLAQRKLPQL